MDQTIKNNNDFLLLASESSKLKNETSSELDTETGPGSESELETETNISLLSPNLSVRNKGYEIKFNVKKINEITEIATCDFSKGYLFPIKTHSVRDFAEIAFKNVGIDLSKFGNVSPGFRLPNISSEYKDASHVLSKSMETGTNITSFTRPSTAAAIDVFNAPNFGVNVLPVRLLVPSRKNLTTCLSSNNR